MKNNKITRKIRINWIKGMGGNFRRFPIMWSEALECYVIYDTVDNEYAYRISTHGWPLWIKPGSFKRREKLGWPKPRRKKTILPDSMFSMEELEYASSIMEEMK